MLTAAHIAPVLGVLSGVLIGVLLLAVLLDLHGRKAAGRWPYARGAVRSTAAPKVGFAAGAALTPRVVAFGERVCPWCGWRYAPKNTPHDTRLCACADLDGPHFHFVCLDSRGSAPYGFSCGGRWIMRASRYPKKPAPPVAEAPASPTPEKPA